MPRFDYQCKDCQEEFEYFIVRSDDHPYCPICESQNLKKKVSLFAVGKSGVKAPPQTSSKKSEKAGHVCTSSCNHGSKTHSFTTSDGMHVGCGKGYAEKLRKKHGY